MNLFPIVFIWFNIVVGLCYAENWFFREKIHYGGKTPVQPINFAPSHHQHTVTFAIKLKNLDKLEEVALDVSDPASANYGKHWTREQVATLIQNQEGSEKLQTYLINEGISIVSKTPYGEFITASAKIAKWEKIFATRFHEFPDIVTIRTKSSRLAGGYINEKKQQGTFFRALEYSLSEQVNEFIESVFNVVDFPVEMRLNHLHREAYLPPPSFPPSSSSSAVASDAETGIRTAGSSTPQMTPSQLYSLYSINPEVGNHLTSQAAYECLSQGMSPSDLTIFQSTFELPHQALSNVIGGNVENNACAASYDNCDEANLDYQYLMAIGRNINTTALYIDGCDWLTIIQTMQAMKNPPAVLSMSYSQYENGLTQSYVNSFNSAAVQLCAMGVTLLSASGDDGAPGFDVTDSLQCEYGPQFPASSPYVTAVGATQGPEYSPPKPETVCSSQTGGGITSGGGFALYSPLPSWQATVVNQYLTLVDGTSNKPVSGYNTNGRGYPDIAAVGHNYIIVANATLLLVSGTSASTPVVGGMVALVNAARAKAGQSAMGWINPFLYSTYSHYVNDITSGNNLCAIDVCCSQGFYAQPGWDPTTGLGSVNWANFLDAAMSGYPTLAPVSVPTAPTKKPVTASPTRVPSPIATVSPSASILNQLFNGNQRLDNVDVAAYSDDSSAYDNTIKQSIQQMFTGNVVQFTFFDVSLTADSSASAVSSFSSLRKLQAVPNSGSLFLTYTLSITSGEPESYFVNVYNQMLTTGQFTSILQSVAISNQQTGLSAATSTSGTLNGPSNDDGTSSSSSNPLSLTEMIVIIVIGAVFIFLLMIAIYYSVKRCRSNDNNNKPVVLAFATTAYPSPAIEIYQIEIDASAPPPGEAMIADNNRSNRAPPKPPRTPPPKPPRSPHDYRKTSTQDHNDPYSFPQKGPQSPSSSSSASRMKKQKIDYKDAI